MLLSLAGHYKALVHVILSDQNSRDRFCYGDLKQTKKEREREREREREIEREREEEEEEEKKKKKKKKMMMKGKKTSRSGWPLDILQEEVFLLLLLLGVRSLHDQGRSGDE